MNKAIYFISDAQKQELHAHPNSVSFDFSKIWMNSRCWTPLDCTELLAIPTKKQSPKISQKNPLQPSRATATEHESSRRLHLFNVTVLVNGL